MGNCVRKKKRTEIDARAYALTLIQRDAMHSNIKAYKCRYCGHWHVGHKNTVNEAKEVLNLMEKKS